MLLPQCCPQPSVPSLASGTHLASPRRSARTLPLHLEPVSGCQSPEQCLLPPWGSGLSGGPGTGRPLGGPRPRSPGYRGQACSEGVLSLSVPTTSPPGWPPTCTPLPTQLAPPGCQASPNSAANAGGHGWVLAASRGPGTENRRAWGGFHVGPALAATGVLSQAATQDRATPRPGIPSSCSKTTAPSPPG